MRYIETTKQPKRRTISFQCGEREHPSFPTKAAKVIHVIERYVWTRFIAEFDGKVLCTSEHVEQTEEVAFDEGRRELVTHNRKASAAYAVDWLYDGSFYVRVEVQYHTGDYSGVYTSAVFPTRDECIEYFLNLSRRHFGDDRNMPESQHEARNQMQKLLEPSLFGFLEPSPVPW